MEGSKQNLLLYAGIAAIVVVLVGYLLFHGTLTSSAQINQTVSSSTLSTLSSIANNQTLASTVGIGAYAGITPTDYIKKINDTPLMYNGKPELLDVGAEFCPYCAASRWPMILALMRFGNITGIVYSESSPTDVYPNTPTFSFYNYSYSSSYLSFNGFETETRTQQPLETLDPASANVFYKYGNAIPFVDFGNRITTSGSLVGPGLYKGLSWTSIISQLQQPGTQLSQEVIGAANIYTAEICYEINNSAPVCSANYVVAARNRFLS